MPGIVLGADNRVMSKTCSSFQNAHSLLGGDSLLTRNKRITCLSCVSMYKLVKSAIGKNKVGKGEQGEYGYCMLGSYRNPSL